jgi:TetR/AcrR family transcriptional regulator, cholesterol catabolism regulator
MADNKKQIVLNEAVKLISTHGYHATSMRDLAKALDIEAASIYNHISSKEEILQLTCFSLAKKFLTAIDEVNDIYFNAEEKLRLAIKNHVEILTDNLYESGVFLHEWKNLSEPFLTQFKEMRNNYESGFKTIVQNGIDEGLFHEVDKKFAVLTILSSVNWIIEWYNPKGSMSPEQIAEKLSDFILKGLTKPLPY